MWYQLYNRQYDIYEEGENTRRDFSTSKEVLEANKKLRKQGTRLAWIIAQDQNLIQVHMQQS